MINEEIELKKLKEYMVLCGIQGGRDLVKHGGYHASEQYANAILRGDKKFTEKAKQDLYTACNVARMWHLTHKGED
jgi:hypothetical protein